MTLSLFNHEREEFLLGTLIGEGGEGKVYALQENAEHVLKVFSSPVGGERRAKIEAMVASSSEDLQSFTAWPLQSAYDKRGNLVGFLMRRINDAHAIHRLFNPSHRKTTYPGVDWSFLVRAAQNLCAAVAVVHKAGHVIGDINQSNVLVSKQAMVSFIDCDSFQLRTHSKIFRCEVGNSHYTPPELQGIDNFRSVDRTPNHDLFGMGILIFQLLFNGRHPFSGRVEGDRDLTLEAAIREFLFAYSPNIEDKSVSQPPATLSYDAATPHIRELFDASFLRPAHSSDQRPSALDWRRGLKEMELALGKCSIAPQHCFVPRLGACPWCDLERATLTEYFPKLSAKGNDSFDLVGIWRRIDAIPKPTALPVVDPGVMRASARPCPPGISYDSEEKYVQFVLWTGVAALMYQYSIVWYLVVLGGFFASYLLRGKIGPSSAWRSEKRKRYEAFIDAEQRWNHLTALRSSLQEKMRKVHDLYGDLAQAKKDYKSLSAPQAIKKTLDPESYRRQLSQFLSAFPIEGTKLIGLNYKRRAALARRGILSANHVDHSTLASILELNDTAIRSLLRWRRERTLLFPYAKLGEVTDAQPKNNQKLLQQQLRSGYVELAALCANISDSKNVLERDLHTAAHEVSQTRADWEFFF